MLGWLGLLGAVLAFGTASLLQANGARKSEGQHRGLRYLLDLARSGPYAAGTALDLIGVVLTAVALRDLPLFLVQAATASSLVVTAVGSALLFPAERRPGLWRPVIMVTAGLAMIGAAAAEGESAGVSTLWRLLLALGLPLLFGAQILLRRTSLPPAIRYAAITGLAYAGMGISLRALHVPDNRLMTLAEPAALLAAGYLAMALLMFGRALQHGSVTQTMAIVVSTDTVLPAIVGVLFLGDRTRPGGGGVVLAGMALTVGAVMWLIRATAGPADRPAAAPEVAGALAA